MDEPSTSSTIQWKCAICNDTKFTDKSYYDIHLGTKKHKRNLRAARQAVYERQPSSGISTPRSTSQEPSNQQPKDSSDSTGLCDYKSIREGYRQRNNNYFEDNHTAYVNSTIAYWAIKLALNPTVHDFKITVSDKVWEEFGDAVVEIRFRDLPEKPSYSCRCAVHFKNIVSYTVKSLDSFSQGKFSFEGITRQIQKIKSKNVDETRFYVFTTSVPDPSLNTAMQVRCCQCCRKTSVGCKCPDGSKEDDCHCQQEVFAKALSNRRNLILNTSEDNETVFRFYPKINKYTLPNINVYSGQKRLRDFPKAIKEILSEYFGEKRPEIAKDFIKYVEQWGRGKCGGFFKLKKEDVLVKLGQLLLAPFRVTPKIKSKEPNNFDIWIRAIKSADVTVLKHSADLCKYLEPFNLFIEQELAQQIDTTNDTIKIERTKAKNDTKDVNNAITRSYLIEDTLKDCVNEVPLEKLYLIFWKSGLMPLVLQVDNDKDQEHVLQVASVLKKCGLTRRYFVRSSSDTNSIPTSVNKLSLFVTLDDISDELGQDILNSVRIGVTENFSISLGEIERTDKFFKKNISATEFFDMTLGKYVFKAHRDGASHRQNEHAKLVLGAQLMARLKQEVEARSEVNIVLLRERNRGDAFDDNWLRGVNPDLFLLR